MKINTLTHGKLISLSGASLLFEYGDKKSTIYIFESKSRIVRIALINDERKRLRKNGQESSETCAPDFSLPS